MKNIFKNKILKYFIYFIFLTSIAQGFNYFFQSYHKEFSKSVVIGFSVTLGMFISREFLRKK